MNDDIISLDSKYPLDYFKNLFDKVIDNDNKSEELFKILVIENGTKIVYTLTKLLNYGSIEKKILFDKAFRICTMLLFEKTHTSDPVEFAFGCRSPKSKGVGYWDGAFVIIKSKDDVFKAFAFEYKKDSISEVDNLEESIKLYTNYIKSKWIPMNIDDIKKTTGVEIDINTITSIKIKNKINKNIVPIIVGGISGIVTAVTINLIHKILRIRK